MVKIYGVILTDALANSTCLIFKVTTAFVNICHKGNCLFKVYMDSFVLRYFLIELIRVFHGAVFYTGSTTGAFVLVNICGLFNQGYLKVSGFPLETVNFSIGHDLYIGMPFTFNKLRRFNAHGAVIGGKRLVQLGHVAADSR